MLLNINATHGPTDCCSATHGLLLSDATGLWDAESIILIGDAASRRGLSRVGNFITLNGPLNVHPPSILYTRTHWLTTCVILPETKNQFTIYKASRRSIGSA